MKIIWRWNTFKQFQNHQPSIFRPLQEPAPPASGFPIGFGQPQQANNLVITQLGRNMQWIPSFLGPSPRSKWRMKLATQLTNCGCNPAYFKTHKNIQKVRCLFGQPRWNFTYKSQLWLVLDQYQDKWLLPLPPNGACNGGRMGSQWSLQGSSPTTSGYRENDVCVCVIMVPLKKPTVLGYKPYLYGHVCTTIVTLFNLLGKNMLRPRVLLFKSLQSNAPSFQLNRWVGVPQLPLTMGAREASAQ